MIAFGASQGRVTTLKFLGGEMQFNPLAGDADVVGYLQRLGLRMGDLRPVLDRFGQYLVWEHIPAQFGREGTPARWAPLSPAYRAWKERMFPGRTILVRTGAMEAGFRWEARARSLRIVNRVRSGQGGGQPRWVYHQFGTARMPARPMLQITQVDVETLRDFAAGHLELSREA